LEGEEAADLNQFTEKVWPHIKEFYKPPGSEAATGEDTDQAIPVPPRVSIYNVVSVENGACYYL